jgi:predicted nucleotide-binding protein
MMSELQTAMTRLSGLGFAVGDFSLPANPNQGSIYYYQLIAPLSMINGYLKREIAREERRQAEQAIELRLDEADSARQAPGNNTVFVVLGQDSDAVQTVFALLREVELVPRDFADARRLTKHPMPYVGQVLDTAFETAQAVLVLFTPDERVELKDRLRNASLPIVVEFQPRPNVLIEAGIALTTHPDRTVVLEMGNVRSPSDLAGRHVVRWKEDSPAERQLLLERLEDAGCQPVRNGTRWMNVGKVDRPTWV